MLNLGLASTFHRGVRVLTLQCVTCGVNGDAAPTTSGNGRMDTRHKYVVHVYTMDIEHTCVLITLSGWLYLSSFYGPEAH